MNKKRKPKNDDLKNTVKWAFFEGDFSKFAGESSVLSERKKCRNKSKLKKKSYKLHTNSIVIIAGNSWVLQKNGTMVIIKNMVLLKIIYVSIVVGIDIGKIYVTNVKMSLWLN